jgi:phosphoglycerate dehydrogenase-like enzyme
MKLATTGDLRNDVALTGDVVKFLDGYEIVRAREILSDETIARDVEVLVRGLDTEDSGAEDLIDALTNLKWIHSMTAGVEDVISESLLERGIFLTNSAGCHAEAIAEYVLAGIVGLFRGIPSLLAPKPRGTWLPHIVGREVAGSRVGIVGYGGIGHRVAELASSWGAEVWAIRRDPTRVSAEEDRSAVTVTGPESLHSMLEVSDVVVVTTSLNASSRHLLGEREFAAMKNSAYLVNVSRGAVIDEDALYDALTTGSIAGALIDTTDTEPLPADSKLWSAATLWITPHMAGATRESRTRALSLLDWNLTCYRRGAAREFRNVVDVARELDGRSSSRRGDHF